MKNKITLLISISILALIALSAIQGYLISNTYELKRKAFLKEVDSIVSEIDDEEVLDSLYYEGWGQDLTNHIADYKNKRIRKIDVLARAKMQADSINALYLEYYNQFLDSLNLDYTIKYHKNLIGVVIFDGTMDTLLAEGRGQKIKILGEPFSEEEAVNLSNSRWFASQDYVSTIGEKIETKDYDLEVRTQDMMVITDWRRVVLGRMALLLAGSILLFLFVIALLYYAIKNLITQKKIAEVKTDFINNITHELKTPLATLGIATKSLRNDTIKTNVQAFNNTLGIVERQNRRLQKLIDQVLTNSLSANELVLSKDPVIDNVLFNELLEDFKLSIQHNNVQIINEVYMPEVLLRIDRFHFTTAIQNILENAVKYGQDPITIIIKTSVHNGQYLVNIQDNGIGISSKDQRSIFEKFYRVNEGNIHDVKGLGLGLYFTHQIITAHKGTVGIESALGEGTTFTIKIPLN